jgi:crotonobetainyl-CoA:carnitine CoA-transferase CaiB-like acyl-CoA transferase
VIDQSHGQKPGLSFVDYAAGYNAAFAISAVLFRREREGKGAHISCSMFETALMLMAPELAAAMRPGAPPKRTEAGVSMYETAAGTLMLGAFSPPQNARLWKALAAEGFDARDFAGTRDWPSLWKNADAMRAALSAIFLTRTADDWQALLHANGLPAERMRTLAEAGADPQLAARNFFAAPAFDAASADPLPVAAYRFDADGPSIETPAPGFAEHTDAVLAELGLSEQVIAELRAGAVVA